MRSVYIKELKSYFGSMYAYIMLAAYLFFSGLFTAIVNLFGASSSIELAYGYTAFVFLLAVPFLSLRGIADERRQKTDVLLGALPLKKWEIIIGKYFAMITLVGIGQLIAFANVFILACYGNINIPSAICGTFAYFLCSAALIAVGLFISTLSSSIITASLLNFAAMLIIYFLPDIITLLPTTGIGSFLVLTLVIAALIPLFNFITGNKNIAIILAVILELINIAVLLFIPDLMEGAAAKLFSTLSITDRLSTFTTYGLFDISAIIYFLSVTVIFLILSVISLDRGRYMAPKG